MTRYIVHRFAHALVTIWAISLISFLIIQLPPGDFVDAYIANLSASGNPVSLEQAESMRRLYGLDRPMLVQYGLWIERLLSGDFGISMEWGRPVAEVVGDRLWLTMALSLAALIVTWGIAMPVGIVSAVRQYSIWDYAFTFVGFVGIAIPGFLLALVVMYFGFVLFDVSLGGLFSAEYALAEWSWGKFGNLLGHLPLPVLILAMGGTAQLIRIMRANLLDELRKPYVVTARAKGMKESRVVLKYPVRAALNPFASTVAYLFPYLISGSIVISLVLGLPTVGPLLLRALISQDMYLAGVIILMLGIFTVVGTFVSDLLLMWIDPKIRFQVENA